MNTSSEVGEKKKDPPASNVEKKHEYWKIKSSVVHNHIKNSVENNLLNFSLTHTTVRPSIEANEVKGTAEANIGRLGIEAFGLKFSTESGIKRCSRSTMYSTTSASSASYARSYSTNKSEERSFGRHLGKRYTVTLPPYLDVAIIDANGGAARRGVFSELVDNLTSPGDFGWDEKRSAIERKSDMEILNASKQSTNYIYLEEHHIPADARKYLENLKEWDENKQDIITPEKFKALLETTASPVFPGIVGAAPFKSFKGGGINADQAKALGATCRLQVSHRANQTIQIFSQALRTIRFNAVSTIDNGKNNQVYLGGKYEHVRGYAHVLVEGPLLQHHRKIRNRREQPNAEPNEGLAKYRYEDGASFAFVKATAVGDSAKPDKVDNLWSILLAKDGLSLGNTREDDAGVADPDTWTQGIKVSDDKTHIRCDDGQIEISNSGIKFVVGEASMQMDEKFFTAGDLIAKLAPGANLPK